MERFINWKNRLLQSWTWIIKYLKNGLENKPCSQGQSAHNRSRKTLRDILIRTYHTLVLPDGETKIGDYIISKKTLFPEKIIGADYCAVREIDNGFLILFGDAAGHGIVDSLTAVICMTVFNATSSEDPEEILRKINKILWITRGQSYSTCIRIQNDEVFYCGRIDEAVLGNRPLDMNCSVLGASDIYECESKVAKFEDIDILRLRTDGALYDDETDDQMEVIIRKEEMIAETL